MDSDKTQVYDHVIRVPFLLKGPGIVPGQVLPHTASMADVAPTILVRFGILFLLLCHTIRDAFCFFAPCSESLCFFAGIGRRPWKQRSDSGDDGRYLLGANPACKADSATHGRQSCGSVAADGDAR